MNHTHTLATMPSPPARRRKLPALLIAAVLAALGISMALWPRPSAIPQQQQPPGSSPRPTTTTLILEPMQAAAPAAEAATRELAADPSDSSPNPHTAVDFAQRIDALAALGEATAAYVQDEAMAEARQSDAEAQKQFGQLLELYRDAGERSLELLQTIPDAPTATRDHSRRTVLELVLRVECEQRFRIGDPEQHRTLADDLVAAILSLAPLHAAQAELAQRVLDRQPYLGPRHEPAVLELAQFANDGLVPREVATRLLLTLWDNLQRSGARSSADLTNLALAMLSDTDPSKRTAACRHLLADQRYRGIVLAWLREHQQSDVARELVSIAALELPPAEAIQVLRDMHNLVGSSASACMVLGVRAPMALGEAYQDLLASDTYNELRVDLLSGLSTAAPAQALPVLELAISNDPKPDVRTQAVLSITATAPATHGEAACTRALEDPAIANDPLRLGVVLFALQNLESAGLINAVDRLGQRMRQLPLRSDTRLALEQLLARSLPGGQTSDHQGPDHQRPDHQSRRR